MPTFLVLGGLLALVVSGIAARRSHKRFLLSGDAFRCRLRVWGHPSAIWPSLARHWSRPMWAKWHEDVLVVRRTPARTIPLRVQAPVDGVRILTPPTPRLCGPRPIGVVLQIWDGSRIEIAAAAEDRMTVVGPYVTAAITDLPHGPIPRGPR